MAKPVNEMDLEEVAAAYKAKDAEIDALYASVSKGPLPPDVKARLKTLQHEAAALIERHWAIRMAQLDKGHAAIEAAEALIRKYKQEK